MVGIVDQFKHNHTNIIHNLSAIGVAAEGLNVRNVEVDFRTIAQSMGGTENWSTIVKGFLNICEFMFIFSITENALKDVTGTVKASDLVKVTSNRHPEIYSHLQSSLISKKLAVAIWDLYYAIRNIYAHSHGVISPKDKEFIREKSNAFVEIYNNEIHSADAVTGLINNAISGDVFENILDDENIKIGRFFFLGDNELNVFRNFAAEFMNSLSKTGVERAPSRNMR